MSDTIRTWNALLTTLFADGQAAGSITPQDVRDLIATVGAQTRGFASGEYYTSYGTATTGTPAEGRVFYIPFLVDQETTFDRIAVITTVAGSTGAVARLGIYGSNASGHPGSLVLDAGTVDGTLTGVQEITISQVLPRGVYWLASVVQGAATTRPTFRVPSVDHIPFVGIIGLSAGTYAAGGYFESGVAGALPSTATPSGTAGGTGGGAKPFLRAA